MIFPTKTCSSRTGFLPPKCEHEMTVLNPPYQITHIEMDPEEV